MSKQTRRWKQRENAQRLRRTNVSGDGYGLQGEIDGRVPTHLRAAVVFSVATLPTLVYEQTKREVTGEERESKLARAYGLQTRHIVNATRV